MGEPISEDCWTLWQRKETIHLSGFDILPMSKSNIIEMYSSLATSKWWVDQSEDLYLAAFFGEVTNLGSRVNGKWFGISSWRPKLRARFKLDCVYESLSRFSDPMTGQQKNLLAALVSMAQMETVLVDPYTGKGEWVVQPEGGEFVIQEETFNKNVEQMRRQEAMQKTVFDRIVLAGKRSKKAHLNSLDQNPLWAQRISVVHSEARCVRQYCKCDLVVHTPDRDAVTIRRAGRKGTGPVIEAQMLNEVLGVYHDFFSRHKEPEDIVPRRRKKGRVAKTNPQSIEPQDRLYVDIIGSRMGLDSGMWHLQFLEFMSTYYSTWGVRFFDPYESSDKGTYKGVEFEHRREMYVGPRNTLVQVDDAQAGEEHVRRAWLRSPYYSMKKEGHSCFGIRERRAFSHVEPYKFVRSLSSCACLRCKATTYLADVYGGWAAYERFRGMLALLGPVCEHSSMISTTQQIIEAERAYRHRGQTIPERLRPFVRTVKSEGALQEFIQNRAGAVYAYLPVFEGMVFSRELPLDFVVDDSPRSLQEVGMVQYFITQNPAEIRGYGESNRIDDFRILRLKAEEPVCSLELKF